jgi:7,8-dihydroneopterin aldolase/epimerase/oxygenase
MSATIILKNLRVHTVIGVYDEEKTGPQALRLDIELTLKNRQSSVTDRLRDTVDYDQVIAHIRRFATQHQHELLERFTYELAQDLLDQFPLAKADITTWKTIAAHAPTEIAVRVQMQAGEKWHVNFSRFDDEHLND